MQNNETHKQQCRAGGTQSAQAFARRPFARRGNQVRRVVHPFMRHSVQLAFMPAAIFTPHSPQNSQYHQRHA